MLRKVFLVILFILLFFIIMPVSFSLDENLTALELNNNILNEDVVDEIHVDTKGNDDNQGDLQHPVSTISKAIEISSNNSKIVVHEGIYRENNLNITKSLEIQGQGNVIIDADKKNRIFTINTATSDKVLLSGITFINGESKQMAGAIYVLKAVTTIKDCKFINNSAATEGGAIYWNGANGRLTNTVFENNFARDGSAVKWGESDTSISLGNADYGQITNCTFDNNHILQDEDGCIGLSIYSNNVKVQNSRFINHKTSFNTSFEVLYINGDYGSVESCLFENNAMTLTGALGLDGNYAKAIGNTFIHNTVYWPESFGGAIGIQSETGTIYNNTFIANGGESCFGGAVYINIMEDHQFSFINITKNIFKSNTGLYGGDVYANGQNCMLDLKINNNIFESSKATSGAAVYVVDIWSPVTITNNTFKDLIADNGAGIYTPSCILDVSKNLMYNCTSKKTENIYSNSEIKGNLKLKFLNITGALNRTITLKAILTDDMGNRISTNKINYKVNNTDIKGIKGLNTLNITYPNFGSYMISGNYEFTATSVETSTLTVLHGVNLAMTNITNYGGKVMIIINLTDDEGNPIKNAEIYLNVHNNDLLLITNENGMVQKSIDFNFGDYDVVARFVDNKFYMSTNATSTIPVLSSIVSSDAVKAYNSGCDFKAQLLKDDGSPLNNIKVYLTVNGVKNEVLTDSSGFIKFNQKLQVGLYTITVLNPLTSEEETYSLNIVERIVDNKNINVYFGTNAYFKARIVDDEGNFASAGEIVQIKVNGKAINVKTDKNGFISYRINLNPKTYSITTTYKGFKVSNKIIIKPVLTAKNISKKKAKKIKFTAKLVNTKGKSLKGKKITFKVKGKTYKAKTNKKGIATIYIKNLKVGKYKVTAKYGKSTIKNTIKIKK